MLPFTELLAQITPPVDTIAVPELDSTLSTPPTTTDLIDFSDQIAGKRDSSSRPNTNVTLFQSPNVKYSKDSLDSEVESFGNDSMRYDIKNTEVHLWGDAYVKYKTITLTADYIIYNWTSNLVTAEGTVDSLTRQTRGMPNFKDGEEAFDAGKLKYNFKTGKGKIYDAVTQYNDVYVRSGEGKFLSKDASNQQLDDHIYSCDAIFTTCNHPHPHFGIRSRKQKVIPNKVVVVGPSNVELGGVPTPLWLPFGFFPLKQGQRTGLVFPQDYEYSEEWGFGLRNVGWYFPMNDYIDLILTGDIYTRGTFRIHANSRYKKKYKYNGSFLLDFSNERTEIPNTVEVRPNRSFRFVWNHKQDRTAHPTNTFGGGINFQTNSYQAQVLTEPDARLNTNIGSNLNFSKTFPGKPFNITAGFNHSQNARSRAVTIVFPDFKFRMKQIYPFKGKRKPGKTEQWYEQISLTYNADALNRFTATDTTVFTQQTLQDAKFGVRHDARLNTSFRLLKWFNFTPSVTYKEIWNFRLLERQFDPEAVVDTIFNDAEGTFTLDTVSYGTVIDNVKYGFKPLRLFNSSISMNTAIYGTMQFKKGWLRGLRHIAKPSFGLSYTPDYTNDAFGYFKEVQTDSRFENEEDFEQYSIFTGGAFNDQPSNQGKSMALTYGVQNIFEGKYYSKKDSSLQKFRFLNTVDMRGSYNIAADSFQWSTIRMSGATRLFGQFSNLQLSATYDPLDFQNGRRVDKTVWSQRKKLFRFVDASARLSTRITVKQLKELITGKPKKLEKGEKAPKRVIGEESLLTMLENFSFNHSINMSLKRIYNNDIAKDTFQISTHTISMSGKIQLTDKWGINFQQISYDFKSKQMVYPSLTFYRDLHCWELSMAWRPSINFFSFSLKVKPGSLDFLKVPYGRNRADGARAF